MNYVNPQYLIDAQQLQVRIGDPNLRIFDTSVLLTPAKQGYQVESGYDLYQQGHIPGAGFIDLANDWAAPHEHLRFTLPDVQTLQTQIGASGIHADHQVVLYSSGHLMWATRAWWLLYHAGHRNIAVLNGNFRAWQKAGLAVESGSNTYPETTFAPNTAPSKFADTQTVQAGMEGAVCTVNSLSKSLYEGTGDFYYHRRGHIPGSVSLFYDALLDDEFFLPAEALAAVLSEQGMLAADEVITYCGGGIAATIDAFACLLCGQESIRVYDGSMSEWVQDSARPLREGPNP